MIPLKWFRYQASFTSLGLHFLGTLLVISLTVFIGRSDDVDGDGFDDETGEFIEAGSSFEEPPQYSYDPGGDDDSDGLLNQEEIDYGTRPDLADSDGDGLDDGDEIYGIY